MELKELLESLGLDEGTVTKIVDGMAQNKIYTTTEENADVRLSKSKAQRKELEEELTTAKQLVEELKSKSVTADELQGKILGYEKEIESLKETRKADRLNSFIDLGLTKANVRNLKAVKSLLNMDSIVEDEKGEYTGLTEQLDALKESDGYLFNASEPEQPKAPTIVPKGNPSAPESLDALDQALFNGFDRG